MPRDAKRYDASRLNRTTRQKFGLFSEVGGEMKLEQTLSVRLPRANRMARQIAKQFPNTFLARVSGDQPTGPRFPVRYGDAPRLNKQSISKSAAKQPVNWGDGKGPVPDEVIDEYRDQLRQKERHELAQQERKDQRRQGIRKMRGGKA